MLLRQQKSIPKSQPNILYKGDNKMRWDRKTNKRENLRTIICLNEPAGVIEMILVNIFK